MGKSLLNVLHINGREGTTNGAGNPGEETGTGARVVSFIITWVLAILLCLAFWYGVYLLIQSLISTSSWQT